MRKYLECILYGFATLATIAIFVGFVIIPSSRAYGDEQSSASTTSTSCSVNKTVSISASSGETSESIKNKLPLVIDIVVTFFLDNGKSSISNNSASVNWVDTPSGYTSSCSKAYNFKWTGSIPNNITVDGKEIEIEESDRTITANVEVSAPETLIDISGYEDTYEYDNETAISTIKSNLPETVTIITSKQEYDSISVNWILSKYDEEAKAKQTVTATGTVEIPSGVTYDKGKNIITSTITVNARTYNILTYEGVSEGRFTGDTDELGLKWSNKGDKDDNYDLDRRILAAQTDSIKNAIYNGMTNDQSIYLRLVATEKDEDEIKESITSKIEEAAEKSESDAEIGKYFDLSLYAVIGDKSYPITNTGDDNAIKIKYNISTSASFYKAKSTSGGTTTTRYYRVYRYHKNDNEKGVVDKVSGDWTSETSLTIKSSLFSPFATAYYDEASSSSSSSSSARGSSFSSSRAAVAATSPVDTIDNTGGTDGASGSRAPKTGDDFNAKMWIFFIVVGVVVTLCSLILFQDTKEWQEEKKTES